MPIRSLFQLLTTGDLINVSCECGNRTQVSAAADILARRRGSAQVKYSVSHHMVIKPFLLLNTDLDGG